MSDEFRVMNSLDDWKSLSGHVLVYGTRLTMKSDRGGRQVGRIQKRAGIRPTHSKT